MLLAWILKDYLCHQVKKFIWSRSFPWDIVSLLQNGGRSKECAPEVVGGQIEKYSGTKKNKCGIRYCVLLAILCVSTFESFVI